ncbi:MAG TPA: preprotein translocase subunit SecG [Lysobacter sp.]|nr:preprotein translocase subunit SecG [Lysobacter sp.]
MLLFLNAIYLLIAIAMIALILMQRGAGAQAGAGFGGGASATVFGARGASSFLSKSTKWLGIAFFSIAMFMAWHATDSAGSSAAVSQDLGVMSQIPVTPAPSGNNVVVPVVPGQVAPQPAPATDSGVPAAPTAPQSPESAPPDSTGK